MASRVDVPVPTDRDEGGRVWPIHAALIAFCAVIALPLVWMVLTALKTQQEIYAKPFWWVPSEPHLADNVRRVFVMIPFARYFLNSVVVSTFITVSDVFFSTLAGYALAKYRFPGRDLLFGIVIATMMVPFIVLLLPQYVIVRDLGWLDSYAGLIVPFSISSFGIFLMRQAFLGMPNELIEAARLDGASEWRILFQFAVPLNVAPLVSLAILRFLGEWDSLLWPLIATSSAEMRTMSLGMALLQGDIYGTDFPMLMTAATLSVAPIVLLYVFLQRYVIKSVAGSGLKG